MRKPSPAAVTVLHCRPEWDKNPVLSIYTKHIRTAARGALGRYAPDFLRKKGVGSGGS